jgi:uncharacterized protein HemX
MSNSDRRFISLRMLFFFVFLVWLVAGVVIYHSLSSWQDRGTLGDMFGAVNALFSGLAFAGVIYAIYLQREELSLQRKELELTRRELKRSAEAQEETVDKMTEQVKMQVLSGKLNALSTAISSYDQQITVLQKSSQHLMDIYGKSVSLTTADLEAERDKYLSELLKVYADITSSRASFEIAWSSKP